MPLHGSDPVALGRAIAACIAAVFQTPPASLHSFGSVMQLNAFMHYEEWKQPHNERTSLINDEQGDRQAEQPLRDVLTKPKILPVEIKWERVCLSGVSPVLSGEAGRIARQGVCPLSLRPF